ncbi:MAG: hypothetical protein OXU51_11560 [Candidatus Poribacteria bacterium]|nr:hypothetical protein [Candidatus Poribacteria bacterium]
MGYFYENKELRYTYGTREKVNEIVRGYLPSLQDYQKLGHTPEAAKQHKEAKFKQDTTLLVTLGAALRDCLRVHIDKDILASFIADVVDGTIENIEDSLTKE